MGQGSGVAVSSDVGRRHGTDPALLWLCRRLAAITPIRPPSLGTSTCRGRSSKKKKKKKSIPNIPLNTLNVNDLNISSKRQRLAE